MANTIYILDDQNLIVCSSIPGVNIKFFGENNRVVIEKPTSLLRNCEIYLGSDTEVLIKKSPYMIRNLRIAGRKSKKGKVIIGENFSCVGCDINLNDSAKVIIGNDCMFSFDISLWTSDGHAIIDILSKKILNFPSDIQLGNHVWVGYSTTILKGSFVGDNCVIGAKSVLTKKLEVTNSVIVGSPAKVARKGITWSRHSPESFKNDSDIELFLKDK